MDEKVLREILERLARIETKIEEYPQLRSSIDRAEELSHLAHNKANINESMIKELKEEVRQINENSRALRNIVYTSLIGMLVSLISRFIHF